MVGGEEIIELPCPSMINHSLFPGVLTVTFIIDSTRFL